MFHPYTVEVTTDEETFADELWASLLDSEPTSFVHMSRVGELFTVYGLVATLDRALTVRNVLARNIADIETLTTKQIG